MIESALILEYSGTNHAVRQNVWYFASQYIQVFAQVTNTKAVTQLAALLRYILTQASILTMDRRCYCRTWLVG